MNLLRITFLTFIFSQLVLAQNPNPNNSMGGGGNNTNNPDNATDVQTGGKNCPFIVNTRDFIDAADLQTIKSLATELKTNDQSEGSMCTAVGDNIGALLQMIDPGTFVPTTTPPAPATGGNNGNGSGSGGNNSGGTTVVNGTGNGGNNSAVGRTDGTTTAATGGGTGNNNSSPPPPPPPPSQPATCTTNPAQCADLLTSLMGFYQQGKCGVKPEDLAATIVSLAVKVSAAAGPEGAVIAISSQVLLQVYNIAKERSGAIGRVNKLKKDEVEQLKDSIKGLMACKANDTYDSTICRGVELNKIASIVGRQTVPEPPATDKMFLKRDNLKKIFNCIQEGKTFDQCTVGIQIEAVNGQASRPVTAQDLIHDRKLFYKASYTADKVEDGQLATFIKTAELFHEKELKELGKEYIGLRNKKPYNSNSYNTNHTNLIKHCFCNYIPAHSNEKDAHYFNDSTRQWDHQYCGRLNACLAKINGADASKELPTFEIFTGKQQKIATDESACTGISKIDELNETDMMDELNKAKFNPIGTTDGASNGCEVAGATNDKKNGNGGTTNKN